MGKFKHFLQEATFGYKETKYLSAFIADIKAGKPIRLGAQGKEETILLYDNSVKKLEKDFKLINGTNFMAKDGQTYTFTKIFKGAYSGHGGGNLSGADWEKVIVVAHNMINFEISEAEAVKMGDVSNWSEKYSNKLNVGFKIVENSGLGAVTMLHYGAGSNNLSSEWNQYFIEMTGKKAGAATKTPKTDMYLTNGINLSLKKEGGSQLMSGGQAEALATLMFAYQNTSEAVKSKAFSKAFDSLTNNVKSDFKKFKNVSITNIKKDIKAGKKSEVIDAVQQQLAKNTEMRNALRALTANSSFKEAIVREAMTGENKFQDKLPKSTHMMVFNENGDASVVAINDTIIKKYASKTKFDISMKAASGNAWVAMKGIVGESVDNLLERTLLESISEVEALNEGFLDKIKDTFSFIKNLISIWISKILNAITNNMSTLLNVMGVKLNMKSPDVSYSI